MSITPHLAVHRFGLGPRAALPADPLAWLDAQTTGAGPPIPPPEGRDAAFALAEGYAAWREHDATPPPAGQPSPVTRLFRAEQEAWTKHLLTAEEPFRERLVMFWLNHFTVAERGGFGVTTAYAGFLRDVVRPRITGRFADLLVAVSTSPSMLYYLDQVASVGPNSTFGRRSGRGLNENLAREILELHSLSPASGYTQSDVTEFARLMTGWGVERMREPFGTIFRPANHEPGPKTVMGKRFEEGPAAYEEALRFLATHPATLRHIAFKLVRHFIADDPPPGAVAAIEQVLRDTGGDLGAAARALLRLPQAADAKLAKLRSPMEWVLAIHRAGGTTDPRPVMGGMAALAQPLWNAPQPNGWPDTAQGWAGPEGVMQRLDLAYDVAGRFARQDPRMLLDATLGPLAGAATRRAVTGAGSARDAIALLFASQEMQRR
jgi:uncharacterized protein (DUF1800 family)